MKTTPVKTPLILLFCSACLLHAQTQPPTFDAASLKPVATCNAPQDPQTGPGTLTIRGRTPLVLIQWAYDLPRSQVSGPPFLMENCFDLIAKGAGREDDAQLRLMLRTLLADRFGLKAHLEQREMQVYALTLAKGGPKFKESPTDGPPTVDRTNPVILSAHHMTLTEVGYRIADEVGRPVTDETGLTGRYEIRMDISPYIAAAGTADAGKLDMMSILFTGLTEQLGLKLESRKSTVPILVIDHAEKSPTEN